MSKDKIMTEVKRQPNTYLSKSLFIRGLQCHKSLYLHKYHPDLRDEISEELEARFQTGYEVGEKAHELFPGGTEIPYDPDNYQGQVEETRAAIEKGIKTIYEATFSHNNVFVKVDILRKAKKGWEIYEVKSSTKIEDVHLNDTAVQYYVLKGSGLDISRASVVCINNEYVRDGEIDVKELFSIEDVTDEVMARQESVHKDVKKLQRMLQGEMPDIDIGEHCTDPYECDFHGHCWKDIPAYSVFSIGGRGIKKFELYRKGITHIEDIPLHTLNSQQKVQVESYLGKKQMIDKKQVKEFLDSLWYPLYFLDFETFNTPIPVFNGTRPYQQIPFQYSLHCIKSKGGKLQHTEYLAHPGNDYRKELLLKLLGDIPENACVVAYNSAFETQVLNNVKEQFPKYKGKIDMIIKNMRDLAAPFRKRGVYHYKMNGSYSLKAVLPVLVPELSYDNLQISDGGMAVNAYFAMCSSQDAEEIKAIRQGLLEYCTLDTLAMVKILEKLLLMQ